MEVQAGKVAAKVAAPKILPLCDKKWRLCKVWVHEESADIVK